MLKATGATRDGVPIVMIGLTPQECVEMLAEDGGGLVLDTAQLDPRMPQMKIMVFGGPSEEAMADRLQDKFPQVWRSDQAEAQAIADQVRRDLGRGVGPFPDGETIP